MHIGVLGDLEVRNDEGADVVVKGAKLRALLAVLALHAGRSVPADQLVEAVWGEDPPPAVRNGLQGLVSKLRSALGSTAVVAMRGGGYALELPPEAIDAHRFEQLAAAGRAASAAGDSARAIELLGEADSLWRGDALAEFGYEDFASTEITRLSEMRLAAVEERLSLELQRGRHREAISELDILATAHPLREGLRGLLMLAMYRNGRQADALRVFQDGRRLLADELGLDPSPELRRLESAILAHDPSLDGPANVEPAAQASAARRYAIPPALTPLVGREKEVRELTALLHEQRFVTLVGPGGVGKTRLALEVARARSATLAGGACLVELAPVGDPVGVRAAVAAALEVPDPGQLTSKIGDRELLILLDNCEHVIAAAADLADDLLRHCPGLHLIATSREGLRVGGETIWPVPPLAVDDAAQLFIARAQAAGTRLTGDVLATVSEICARLDGLPLAIELAAARTRAFSVEQIASRLTDRFRLLTGGLRTALPRQQTLRAVVDWSYELLFDDEQRVVERLSVFPGGCDLATAEAICADKALDASDLADIISALVEKSLVLAVPADDGGVRFTQLQTLAQYGREKLAERGDSERIRDAMAAHFARLCARSAAAYIGDGQREWLIAVDRERDNIRGALEWAVANDDAETALTIAGGASWPHWLAGSTLEGKRWLDSAFACAGEASDRARALALTGRGLISFQFGEPEGVDADLKAALDIFRNQGDVASMALAYSFYAEVAIARGERDEALRRRGELLDFYRALPNDPFVAAAIAYSQGKIATIEGDLDTAERCYRAAADGFSRTDRPMMRSLCLGMIADFDERSGNMPAAIASLEDAIGINETLGLRGFNGALRARLGWVLLSAGDVARAESVLTRSLEVGRRLTHTSVIFTALSALAVVHQRCGRPDAAAAAAIEALELAAVSGPRRLSNRVDAQADVDACIEACRAVLGDREPVH